MPAPDTEAAKDDCFVCLAGEGRIERVEGADVTELYNAAACTAAAHTRRRFFLGTAFGWGARGC